jgi:AcrR family transcriptional regulator
LTAQTDTTDTTPRRPGRPRSARAERAIHDAALQLLVEQGYEGMSIEAVAARAGVGKATIYRRYAGKDALVAAALRTLNPPAGDNLPDTGNVHDDLELLILSVARTTLGSVVGPMIARVLSASITNPELHEILLAHVIQPRRTAALAILRRGVDRGELRRDLDIELALDMMVGAIFFRIMFVPTDLVTLPEMIPTIVDLMLAGIASSPCG